MADKKDFYKKIFLLGIPLFAGNFSQYLLQLADTVMVGRLGTQELASIAIAGLYCHVLITFLWPLTSGVQAIAARRFGKQKYSDRENVIPDKSSSLFTNDSGDLKKRGEKSSARISADEIYCIPDSDGVKINYENKTLPVFNKKVKELSPEAFTGRSLTAGFAVGIGAGLAAFIFSFASSYILNFLISKKELLPMALEYTYLLRWVFPIAGLGFVISGFLAGVNMTYQIMLVTIGTNLLNIFFNYLFIFGSFGCPRLGVQGAALGTVLAEVIGTVYLLIYLLLEKRLIPYRIFDPRKIETALLRDIIKIASPIVVQNIIALTVFLIYESFIGIIGTVYLASTHIIFSVFRVNKTIVGGFARAGGILAGNYIGADRKKDAEATVSSCAFLGLVIGFFIAAAVLLFPGQIASVFTSDTETALITVKALRFFALFFFIEVFGYSFEIIFAGIGWSRFVLFSEFTTNMVFILFMTWMCVKVMGLGIYWGWLSFGLYQLFHALILTFGWLSKRWLKVEVESA